MTYQKKYLPLIIGIAMATGIFIGGKLSFWDSSERMFSKNTKKTSDLNALLSKTGHCKN